MLVQVAHRRTEPLDQLFVALSSLPLRLALLALAAVLLARRRTAAPAPAVLVVAVLVAGVATDAAKQLTGRVRPPLADALIHPLVAVPHSTSLPSGHAATAFAAATVVAHYRRDLRVAAFVVAALIALSRVWLGVHYPSDVLAGAILGLAVGLLVVVLAEPARRGLVGRYDRSRSRAAPGP